MAGSAEELEATLEVEGWDEEIEEPGLEAREDRSRRKASIVESLNTAPEHWKSSSRGHRMSDTSNLMLSGTDS
jgi:hypothetical protein